MSDQELWAQLSDELVSMTEAELEAMFEEVEKEMEAKCSKARCGAAKRKRGEAKATRVSTPAPMEPPKVMKRPRVEIIDLTNEDDD